MDFKSIARPKDYENNNNIYNVTTRMKKSYDFQRILYKMREQGTKV